MKELQQQAREVVREHCGERIRIYSNTHKTGKVRVKVYGTSMADTVVAKIRRRLGKLGKVQHLCTVGRVRSVTFYVTRAEATS